MALSDVYSQRPYAPAQDDLNTFRQAIGQLPSLEAHKYQMDAKRAEEARANSPMTPWQEAVADLMQEHISPKEVAMKLRMKMQEPGAAPPPVSGAAAHMPQPLGVTSRTETPQMNTVRGPAYNGDETGMQRPSLAQTRMQEDPSAWRHGMTQRDFGEYMGAAGQIGKMRNDRDYLAEIREKNKGSLAVAETNTKGKKEVAEYNAGKKAEEHQKDLDQKTKELKEKIKYHRDFIQLGYDKLKSYERIAEERNRIAGKKDAVLDAMVKLYKAKVDAASKIESSNSIILDEERAKEQVDQLQQEAVETEARIRAHISSNPVEGHTTDMSKKVQTSSTPQGAKKSAHKPGDKVMYKGEQKTVKSVTAEGKLVFE